jgi:TetR/AcrR family transcriptional regulator, mexJK operon transcriptional repressor
MLTELSHSAPRAAHRPGALRPFRSREILIAAAREVFKHQPWQSVSMTEVAAEAGLTRRTLYNQFANAEELFRATREDLILEVARILPLGAPGRFGAAAALRNYCNLLSDAFADPRYGELFASIVRDGWNAPWFIEAYNRHIRVPIARSLETYIQALRPTHVFNSADSRHEALNLLASMESIALSSSLLPGIDQMSPEIANCSADFIDGFMARMNRLSPTGTQ